MSSAKLPTAAKQNLATVIDLERRLLDKRSGVDQIGQAIADFFGSLRFITAHAFAVVVWIALNAGFLEQPFDPTPFPLLGLIIGIEFIFLTTFVLMNQKLQSQRQERWSQLNLQICLLTEQEVTKTMQVLNTMCKHLGMEQPVRDEEITDLARPTPVHVLVEEIDKLADGTT